MLFTELCDQLVCVTKQPVKPSGPCHQTAFVTKRPVSPNGLARLKIRFVFARLFREEAGHADDLRPSRAARKKNFKLKFALSSQGCFGKRPASQTT